MKSADTSRMRAVQIVDPGSESRLVIEETETPTPGPDELLVRVHATALNRADLIQRAGRYPPPQGASDILGLEMAGTVEAWGASCTGWKKGTRVFGLLSGGGYAEYVAIPETLAIRMPSGLSFEEAAAIPEVFLTAYQALYWLGGLRPEESVLIHAGGSGVGTAAIQLARQIIGPAVQRSRRIYVTASPAKHDACLSLGADTAIDYKKEAFDEAILRNTNDRGVNLIVDFIGAPYFEQNIASLGLDGRLILLAMMGGSRLESMDLMGLFRKRIHVKASTLRSRSTSYKSALTADFVNTVLPSIEAGVVNPVIDGVFDWQEVEAAHAHMAANKNVGKIVLKIV